MKNKTLETIIETIRVPSTRWEGLVSLKEMDTIPELDDLLLCCKDDFWVIRWAIIEKIGILKDTRCLPALFKALNDPDLHVCKNAQTAIHRCVKQSIDPVIKRLCHSDFIIQKFCCSYIKKYHIQFSPALERALFTESWLISNKVLGLLFNTRYKEAEPLLLKAIKIKNTQKHAIIMLAIIESQKAIPYFISLYETPSLKRHLIQAFLIMTPSKYITSLINYLRFKDIAHTVQEILIKIGSPIGAYLVEALKENPYDEALLYCLKRIKLTAPTFTLLEKKLENNAFLKNKIDLDQLKSNLF